MTPRVVGGDELALDAAVGGLDVAEADRHDLADFAPEVLRAPQRPLHSRARHLEAELRQQVAFLVELLVEQAMHERERLDGDAAPGAGRGVDGDVDGAAALFEVVQLEAEIGHDRGDGLADASECRALDVIHVDLLSCAVVSSAGDS